MWQVNAQDFMVNERATVDRAGSHVIQLTPAQTRMTCDELMPASPHELLPLIMRTVATITGDTPADVHECISVEI